MGESTQNDMLIVSVIIIAAIAISYALAHSGEPQSAWLWQLK